MKRYLAIFAVALSLGGCAGTAERLAEGALNLPAGVLTESIDNPITPQRSAQIQQSLRVVVAGLRTHKRLCERAVLAASCVDDVNRLQGYVRTARPLIYQLRDFVANNDQINARIVFNKLVAIITDLRRDAVNAGVTIQAVVK